MVDIKAMRSVVGIGIFVGFLYCLIYFATPTLAVAMPDSPTIPDHFLQ
jgi:hypothetical protein